MHKGLILLALLAVLFVSCEEYYKPYLEIVPGTLVVESRLTNDSLQNFVRLSKTRDFYSSNAVEWITGAKVELIQIFGVTTKGIEVKPGYYTFQDKPVVGKSYILWISYNKNIYESEPVVMPPLPKIDSLYTIHRIEKEYRTNGYGTPELFDTPVREINIDATISHKLEYYRFTWRAIIQWEYFPPPPPPPNAGPPGPPTYGWRSIYDNASFNMAGPKDFSTSDKVQKHPVLSLAYNGQSYLDSATQIPANWIVIVDQYGITKNSFDYHEKLNKQFSAEGSLFDPVLTQVYGNIHCKNDPSKIVLGFFDVNSYRQYRYYFNFGTGPDNQVIQRRLNRYFDIPDYGDTIGIHPEFWEDNYY